METCVETAPGHLKSHMRIMAGLDNIPRKEKQFRNFTSNSLNLRGKNESIVGEIWNLLKLEREKRQSEKEQQQQQQQQKDKLENEKQENTVEISEGTPESNERPKIEDSKSTSTSSNVEEIDPTKVQKAMKKVLKKAPNRSMKLKELRNLLGEKLGLSKGAMKALKKLLETAPESTNKTKVKVDGKMITLI